MRKSLKLELNSFKLLPSGQFYQFSQSKPEARDSRNVMIAHDLFKLGLTF